MSKKRLFIAIDFSNEIKQVLVEYQNQLLTQGFSGTIKAPPSSNIHCTLHFLGVCDSNLVPEIMSSMDQSLHGVKAFRATISRAGVFPDFQNPKVFWLGVRGQGGLLSVIFEKQACFLKKLGVELENRSFIPHVTLAYIKQNFSNEDCKKLSAFVENSTIECSLMIDSISLFKSVLTPMGAQHTTIYRRSLL